MRRGEERREQSLTWRKSLRTVSLVLMGPGIVVDRKIKLGFLLSFSPVISPYKLHDLEFKDRYHTLYKDSKGVFIYWVY